MYFLLRILFLLLLASGTVFYFLAARFIEVSYFIKIFHTILGFFATVFFILYSIEHLKKYKASFLKKKSQKKTAYSGLLYILLVGLVLISGVVLFFYDADYVAVWNPIHFYSSWLNNSMFENIYCSSTTSSFCSNHQYARFCFCR